MRTNSVFTGERIQKSLRARFNPVKELTPESLVRMLDSFNAGELRSAALAWETIEQRDDLLKTVAMKRKKGPGRFGWFVEAVDESEAAQRHKATLEFFYRNLTVTHACDGNQRGGLSLLVQQMMDAVGKRYAVHEIVWEPNPRALEKLTATFRFVPLWFFENRTGELRLLSSDYSREGELLEPGAWLVSTGDGLMEASAIAYLYKHLPLRDWLIYCERNGMPGVRGVTDALPGSDEWEAAKDAVREFGAEFHALMSRGTDIEAVDVTTAGELPYPRLVERMDAAIVALWRGSTMGTLAERGTGVTLQARETGLIERDDVEHVSTMLHAQVDRWVVRYVFGEGEPLARVRLRHREEGLTPEQLEDARELIVSSLPQAIAGLVEKLLGEVRN